MQAGYPLIALAAQWLGGGKEGPDLSCERTEEGRDQTNPPAPSERRKKNPRTQVSEE